MKKFLYYLISLFFVVGMVFFYNTEALSLQMWEKTYGGTESDGGSYVQQTVDGGYIITGITFSFGSEEKGNAWLIKTNVEGNEEWIQTFGESQNGEFVQQTTDAGYIIGGYIHYSFQSTDLLLIKTDSEGNEEWTQIYGSPDLYEYFGSALQTPDGGYIMIGSTWIYATDNTRDIWVVKTDSEGNLEWDKSYGDSYEDEWGYDIIQADDDGYIVTGSAGVSGALDSDAYLIKIDSEGNEIWTKTFGYPNSSEDGRCVRRKEDGGYIITGYTSNDFYPYVDYLFLLSTNSQGDWLWDRTFGGGNEDVGYSVDQTSDGGFFIVATTESFGAGERDAWIIKTDSEGYEEWNKTFGGIDYDGSYNGQQTNDYGYIIVGTTRSFGAGYNDAWLIYYNPTAYSTPLVFSETAAYTALMMLISITYFLFMRKRRAHSF